MKVKDIVQYYGSHAAATRALKLSRQCINNWIKRGHIPYVRQLQYERITGGRLKADLKDCVYKHEAV